MANAYICDGFAMIPFSSFLVVDHNINCITDFQAENITPDVKITMNVSDLALYPKNEIIQYDSSGIEIPDPCGDPGNVIVVDKVTVCKLILSGSISYIAGANVVKLDQETNCNSSTHVNNLEYATVQGSVYITNLELMYLDTLAEDAPEYCAEVELHSIQIGSATKDTNERDYVYPINGIFRIKAVANV